MNIWAIFAVMNTNFVTIRPGWVKKKKKKKDLNLWPLQYHCTGITEVLGSDPLKAWIFTTAYSVYYCKDHFYIKKSYKIF